MVAVDVKSPPLIAASPEIVASPHTKRSFAIPTPPSTTNAPVVQLVLCAVPLILTTVAAPPTSKLVVVLPKLITDTGAVFKRLNVEVVAVKSPPEI